MEKTLLTIAITVISLVSFSAPSHASLGDILYGTSNPSINNRLSIGASGTVMFSTGSIPSWVATSSLGISGSLSGGTANWLTYWTSPTTVGATSSPVVGYITATSTLATSTFTNLRLTGVNANSVLFTDSNKNISSDSGFTFDKSTGTLNATNILTANLSLGLGAYSIDNTGLAMLGDVYATNLYSTNPINPSNGGTGISTVPTYGQVLVGNNSGTYTLMSTSSLGISSSSAPLNTNPFQATYFTATSTTATSSFRIASSTCFWNGTTCLTSGGTGTLSGNGTAGYIPIYDSSNHFSTSTLTFATSTGNLTIGATGDSGFALTINDTNKNLLLLQNSSTTGYTRIDYQGTGRTFTSGVGNASETTYNLANKWYVFDYTASSTRLTIDSTGNIGIGTTSPGSKLEMLGASSQWGTISDAGTRVSNLALNTSDANYQAGAAITFGNSQSNAVGSVGWAGIKAMLDNGGGKTTGNLGFFTRNSTADTSLTERIRLFANGNVGIGTTTDTGSKLAIFGTSGSLLKLGYDSLHFTGFDSDYLGNLNVIASSGVKVMTIAPNGNIGIGNTNPQDLLSISAATGAFIGFNRTSASTGYSLLRYQTAGGDDWTVGTRLYDPSGYYIRDGAQGNVPFYANATKVGINNTSPSYNLDVKGTGALNPFNVASSSGTSFLAVTSGGNVGIGSSTPSDKLTVVGGAILNSEYTPATSTTMTIDWTNGNQQLIKLGHVAVTINMSNYIAGQTLRIPLCQDSTGGATVTWDSKILWASSTPPTLSAANHCNLITLDATAGTSTPVIMGGYINF